MVARLAIFIPFLFLISVQAQSTSPLELPERTYSDRLSDAYQRIDPRRDGWNTEALGESYLAALKDLLKKLATGEKVPQFRHSPFRPPLKEVFRDSSITVQRADSFPKPTAQDLSQWKKWTDIKTKVKVTRIQGSQCEALVTLTSPTKQINLTWKILWKSENTVQEIELLDYEEVTVNAPLFSDITAEVLGSNSSYHEQLIRSSDYWRLRLPKNFGLDGAANHGLAVGDVNGDGLEDLYLCHQGGLPNRLYLQQPDGSMLDYSAQSGTDILDYCGAALLIDLDNDGDKDLVVSQDFKILFYDNLDGLGHFEIAFGSATKAQSFSLSAADYDLDGKLDVYICGYNPSFAAARAGALGEPIPIHDANNGGSNILWKNLGDWNFLDVTKECGLNVNNTRFSYAAAWQDADQDGDPDLYVANDFGRNNYYRNDNGHFSDQAAELQLEDTSAGMSICWGDVNRDGLDDIYISNMFSSAGNRITYQKQFKSKSTPEVRAQLQRMARGNTLYQAKGKDTYEEISISSHTTMARWCWGSKFIDLNNDGWLDILAANGFITAEDTGDL